jgi:hypothetical protein
MLDVLQRFSVDGLTRVLVWVLVFWLIWPVICGVLGARRGQAVVGAVHGLCWGPLGVPIVLLSGRKHVCPTCGKRTLSQPIEARVARLSVPPLAEPSVVPPTYPLAPTPEQSPPAAERVCPDSENAPCAGPSAIEGRTASATALERADGAVALPRAGDAEGQADRLYAWVNGNGSSVNPPD